MKKITCVGYHATGSGAIFDLLMEFDVVAQGKNGIEIRVLQDPDGVSDLEYNLIENPHRLNSNFAIKRFKKYVKNSWLFHRHAFGKQWKIISLNYINSLVSYEYDGYWYGDVWLKNGFQKISYYFKKCLKKLFPKKLKKVIHFNLFPNCKYYRVDLTREEFLYKTRKYMDELCNVINKDNKEYVVLDQLLLPSNPARYSNYVDDLKVIVVDRDPRDVYLDQRRKKELVLPKDPYQFCKAYRQDRIQISNLPDNQILKLNFEDIIYNYDETIDKLCKFLNIDISHHVFKNQYFKPWESKKNTKQWEKMTEYNSEIKIIEKELSEFLYKFN